MTSFIMQGGEVLMPFIMYGIILKVVAALLQHLIGSLFGFLIITENRKDLVAFELRERINICALGSWYACVCTNTHV